MMCPITMKETNSRRAFARKVACEVMETLHTRQEFADVIDGLVLEEQQVLWRQVEDTIAKLLREDF